jgi:hypothetical protein
MFLREMLRSLALPGTVWAVCSGTASRLQDRTNLSKRYQQLSLSVPVPAGCSERTCANDDTVKFLHCADVISTVIVSSPVDRQ